MATVYDVQSERGKYSGFPAARQDEPQTDAKPGHLLIWSSKTSTEFADCQICARRRLSASSPCASCGNWIENSRFSDSSLLNRGLV